MRLTNKTKDGLYFDKHCIVPQSNDIIDKLGQLEDIEDELGIDLVTFHKLMSMLCYEDNTCVYVKDLIDYGYLDNTNDVTIREKLVKVSINNTTKVINSIKYVDICE